MGAKENIKIYMIKNKLNISQLSERSGIDERQIRRVLKGEVEYIHHHIVGKYEKMGINVDDMDRKKIVSKEFEELREKIVEYLAEKNILQSEFASITGLDQATLSNFICGRTKRLREPTVKKIVRILSLEVKVPEENENAKVDPVKRAIKMIKSDYRGKVYVTNKKDLSSIRQFLRKGRYMHEVRKIEEHRYEIKYWRVK